MMKTISLQELEEWIHSDNQPALINVLPSGSFKNEHIPFSTNICIYQLDFNRQIQLKYPDKKTHIVVYGLGDPYLAGHKAAKRLVDLGYKNVYLFEGGLIAWGGHLLELEGDGEVLPYMKESFILPVDLMASNIVWTGRNLANSHFGKVNLNSGRLKFVDGEFKECEFTIDMRTISNDDIEDPESSQLLVGHLKSADFLDVDNHPEAVFVSESIKEISNTPWGSPNYKVKGLLMVRGVSQKIKVNALGGWNAENQFIAQGQVDIDRTWFGSIYGSGQFFEHLGMHMVADLISIQVKIVSHKFEGGF